MKKIFIILDELTYDRTRNHLLKDGFEHVAFLFAKKEDRNETTILNITDLYLVPDEELDSSSYAVALSETSQSKIIKQAWDKGASLIEIHSHPFSEESTAFSSYDLEGFKEFVPHVWWRLKGKPYVALVFGQKSFDALAWLDNPNNPQALEGIIINGEKLLPTNQTFLWLKK